MPRLVTSAAHFDNSSLPARTQELRRVSAVADVGVLVRLSRKRMKLSQQAFADVAGVGRRFVSELESGKPSLEFDKVIRVCAAAGVDIVAEMRT